MRWLIPAGALVALGAAVWLAGFGGAAHLAAQAAEGQRAVQNAMAGALRRLQGGDAAALAGLWGLCFAYGFFHAVGPGHGKFLIGGYGLGRRVPAGRLTGLAVAASLAQAGTAIVLVYAGLFALGWGREDMQAAADRGFARLSDLMIAGIGLWLAWRGARALWRMRPAAPAAALDAGPAGLADDRHHPALHTGLAGPGRDPHHRHAPASARDMGPSGLAASVLDTGLAGLAALDHDHDQSGAVCAACGHAHGPTPEQVAAVRTWRDAGLVVAAIAARPCTGALFLLLLTWRIGLDWAGVVGALVMGLGTATVTVVVALASVSIRESALMRAAAGPQTARALAGLELLAGLIVLAVAAQLLRMGW